MLDGENGVQLSVNRDQAQLVTLLGEATET